MGASKHTEGIQTLQQAERCCQQCYTYGATKHTEGIQTYSRASKHMGAFKYIGGVQTYGGIQTYGWCPNIWGHSNIKGTSKHMGASKHTGCIHTYGCIQIYGSIWTPPSVTQHAFYVLCMYRGHPKITQTYSRVFKHMGGIQTYEGAQT